MGLLAGIEIKARKETICVKDVQCLLVVVRDNQVIELGGPEW